ncbi:MAG: Indolepyruvate ferredoxin oxidoreductase [Deltaproteobacteria bacterium]|nr:Indolepyruvate ferredoxin oxidoreductase [Deltaproteobacteria bacterium]
MGNSTLTNILLVGVGGQGIIVASEIMADAFLEAGYDVKKSEVHGMAQRGGSVSTHVRFGPKVFSPLIKEGEADILVAFEELEAMRYLHYLRPKPTIILNEQRLNPPSVSLGKERYPENIADSLSRRAARFKKIAGKDLALQTGDIRTLNIVLLGTLSSFLPVAEEIWTENIFRRFPAKAHKANLEAFQLGRKA